MDRPSQFAAVASLAAGLLSVTSAHAAPTKVNQSDWWGGVTGFPNYVNMYIYVPTTPAPKPPVVVVPHHCGGDANSSYNENPGLVSHSDSNGFIILFPEATGQNCWDAGSARSLNHAGKGDAPAIVQMVRYTLTKYSGDAGRVYSVGGSSGGIMTEALLGVFPDVFMAGISIMGVPCGCWAEGYNDVTGKPSNGTGQWSGPCAGGSVNKTGAQWGDLVRSYFPGYTGRRPRLQHWHGTTDTTINYKNVAEDIKEWTNLLGLSETPTGTDTPKSGTTRQYWKNACGYTVYEAFSLSGVGHSVSVDTNTIATYFGLNDKTTTVDPETAACGAGGTTSTGGASSTGGATGVGGATGIGGSTKGAGGSATGGKSNTAAVTGGRTSAPITGGASSGGGLPDTGGAPHSGGGSANPTGGSVATGGARHTGGSSGTDASSGGSAAQTGGAVATGGSSAQVSTGAGVTGGAEGVGGARTAGGDSSSASMNDATEPPEDGCNCTVVGRTGRAANSMTALLFVALGLAMRRRSRSGAHGAKHGGSRPRNSAQRSHLAR